MNERLSDLIERAQTWMELADAHGDTGPWSETWAHHGIIRSLSCLRALPLCGESDGDDGYKPGAWDEVRSAHMDGHISAEAYETLRTLLATPAEPARESDGVGLREDEREALHDWWDEEATVSVQSAFPIISRIIAARVDEAQAATWDGWEAKVRDLEARVAEAGARAVEDAARPDTLRGLIRMAALVVMEEVGEVDKGLATAIAIKASGSVDTWLRDRARGLRP